MHTVAVIVGRLRRESINLGFAKALARPTEPTPAFVVVDLDDVPPYNESLGADPPEDVRHLKCEGAAADAVLFATPECNRSIPAVVKNVVEQGSRHRGRNSWAGKPAASVGTSPGAIGTAVAQSQLQLKSLSQSQSQSRDTLVGGGAWRLGQAEVDFLNEPGLIGNDFTLGGHKTRAFLAGFIATFATHVRG